MRRRFLGTSLLLSLSLLAPATSRGADWKGTTGSFLTASNWSTNAVPDGDEALINNGGTAQLTTDAVDLALLHAGVNGGTGNYTQTGGVMHANGAFMGESGTATTTISGGEFAIGGDSIHVGMLANGVGVMNISGAGTIVSSGDDFQLGREGTGTLNLSGGFLRAGYTVIGKFGTGTWNQSGGMFDQDFGDIEIGDGGRQDQVGSPGPRNGTMNISGGFVQVADNLAVGNRRGNGSVNITGGVLVATGHDVSSIIVGRGMDTNPGEGGNNQLRIVGGAATVIASGSLLMDPNQAVASATLVEEITGKSHTTIYAAGGADVSSGTLKVVLNGYTPSSNDSWTLVKTGIDIDPLLTLVDNSVAAAGYDPLTHAAPGNFGDVVGPFNSVDTSQAALPAGLSWDVSYTVDSIVLSVKGTAHVTGDFNGDGQLSATDIDLLSTVVRQGSNTPSFDLTGDNKVDENDRMSWVHDARKTWVGDADLSGAFDSSDLVTVFIAGKYETPDAASWADGDFDGDGQFGSGDLVAAFVDGGYEIGPRAAVSAVPEPSGWLLLATGVSLLGRRRRR